MLEQITEKNKLGSAALSDVYSWQATVGTAELTLINTKVSLEKAKLALLNYLALDVLGEYEFVDPNPNELVTGTDLNDVNKLVAEAMVVRNDYKAQQFTLSSAKRGITSAFAGYLPSLRATGSFSTDATDPSALFKSRGFNFGMNLSWSIFSGFSTDLSLQSAKVTVMNAEEDTRAMERQIKIDVKQGILDYQAAIKAFESAETTLKSSTESKKIYVEKYNLGSGTILDVLNADATYLNAAYQKIYQKFQLYRTKDRLISALGKTDYTKYESK
jgi:outer membrane protein